MKTLDEIKMLEIELNYDKTNIEILEAELNIIKKRYDENSRRLEFLMKGGNDFLDIGTKLLFIDSENNEVTVVVAENNNNTYNAILLSDYRFKNPRMSKYYIFEYASLYTGTLIKSIEDDYNLVFKEIIE